MFVLFICRFLLFCLVCVCWFCICILLSSRFVTLGLNVLRLLIERVVLGLLWTFGFVVFICIC